MGYENDAGMSFRCLKFSLYPEFEGELLRGSKQGANRSIILATLNRLKGGKE